MPKNPWVILIAIFVGYICLGGGQTARAQALPANATIDQILDALNARGQGLKDFSADVSLADADNLTGDTTTRLGKVFYQVKDTGDTRLRAVFDIKKIGDTIDKNAKVEYMLDKGMLIDRDYRNKMEVDRQMLKPGQKMNLLKLGEGPFPLPIGQERQEVYKLFGVTRPAAAKDDPADSQHVVLSPLANTEFAKKFKTIDVWVHNASGFPVRVATTDIRQLEVHTTDFGNIKINSGLGDKDFVLEKIKPEEWTIKPE